MLKTVFIECHMELRMISLIHSFISATNKQLICFKILKFTLKYMTNAPACFGLTKPSTGSLKSVLR